MPWNAPTGCPKHHIAALERLVNSYPAKWLLQPQTGEEFDSLDHCNSRLRAFALAKGFDIVRNGGGTKDAPSYRFRCFYHGITTQNNRKLEDRVEVDKEGNITSRRKRDATNVRQLDCPWAALCSYKSVGKRGSGIKAFILTVQNSEHSCALTDDPLSVFPAHLKATEEWQTARYMAKKHREQVLPYSDSRRLIDAEKLGLILSSKQYYNLIRKEVPDKLKPYTIEALLLSLDGHGFIYRTRVSEEEDKEEEGKVISRKLIQLFFAHKEQLEAAKRFCSGWLIVIDGTFNTNRERLPLLVVVGVLNSGRTFPVCFSYCQSESAESISFVWESLKAECFIPGKIPPPRVILGDWAGGLIKSVPMAFPEAQFQGCDWHAVQAMLKWYRGKERNYTVEEVEGSNEKLQEGQQPRVVGLKSLSWNYIKSITLDELKSNKKALLAVMRPHDRWYILTEWEPKEESFIWCYTKSYPNLGSTSSQRGESYHPIVKEITNGQLSFEESGKNLALKVLSILKDVAIDEAPSSRGYNQLTQLYRSAFKHLIVSITNYALKKIKKEWHSLKLSLQADQDFDLGACRCELLLRFGLPCKHHLLRAYRVGMAIPKSLVHPRWWLNGPVVHQLDWQPRYPDEEPVVYQQSELIEIDNYSREIEDLYEQLQPEERARFKAQLKTEHQKLISAGEQHLKMQTIPINKPDAIPKKLWKKKKEHDKADARALTGAEIAEKQHHELQAAYIKATTAKDNGDTPPGTPYKAGESPYSTTIKLAVRPSPERAQPIFNLSPRDEAPYEDILPPSSPPPSTAPPRLQLQPQGQEQGRGKQRRIITAGYKEACEHGLLGLLGHSQTQHHA